MIAQKSFILSLILLSAKNNYKTKRGNGNAVIIAYRKYSGNTLRGY